MNTSRSLVDRSLSYIPSRSVAASPPPSPRPASPPAAAIEREYPACSRWLVPRLALRAARRYWWQILVLWIAGSAGLVALLWPRVQPSYEATAWLRADAAAAAAVAPGELDRFLRTQVELLTSPAILARTLADPRVRDLSWTRLTSDPQARLRAALRVSVPSQTNLILVSMTTPGRGEGPVLINALIDAYDRTAAAWQGQDVRRQVDQLRALQERHRRDVERYRAELEQLAARSGLADPAAPAPLEADRYRQHRVRQGTIELERLAAEATLETLQASRRPGPSGGVEAASPAALAQAIERAYLADAEVVALHAELNRALAACRAAEQAAGPGPTESVLAWRRRVAELRAANEQLWAERHPRLRAQQIAAATPPVDSKAAEIEAAEWQVARLRAEEEKLRAEAESLRVASRAEGGQVLRARFLTSELDSATELARRVAVRLEQVQDSAPAAFEVRSISPAQPPRTPSRDPRLALLAIAPLGMLAALVGLFTAVEARAARVADPDELAARLHLGVLGIVPPLPDRRPVHGPRALRTQRRRLDEFVQSLDHLRVVLESLARSDRRRCCVMIASAIGGEGKTTLAAQLAGRCANAGLMTLLIDADLRRPSLGDLLQVPEGPGLAEILTDEASAEEAIMPVPEAGGFYLLPAGGDGFDPSRLLQGEPLGDLLGRLRDTFDVVLIDVPPVLPVPDALLIGRWTDGAVMAVRHGRSRIPLVAQARRRLAEIGIPILGAVVNGCRPATATYGAYGSYARAGAEAARVSA